MLHFFAVSISFWKDISVLPTVDTFPKSFCFLAIWVQKLCQSCQLNWEQLLGNSLISLILKSYPTTKMPLIFSLSLFFLLFFARTLITIKKRLGDSGSLVLPLLILYKLLAQLLFMIHLSILLSVETFYPIHYWLERVPQVSS